jgi:hypothetical protein
MLLLPHSSPQVNALVTPEELRTLVAFVQGYADQDKNARVTLPELQSLLAPFRQTM